MTEIAMYLGKKGWTLRSGGAAGADTAFEIGADSVAGMKEIYLPWRGFNGNSSYRVFDPHPDNPFIVMGERVWNQRYNTGNVEVPWCDLKQSTKKFMARNIHQILGPTVGSPLSKAIVCWTSDGDISGGTGQTLYAAKILKDRGKESPKIFNLYWPDARDELKEMMKNNVDPCIHLTLENNEN